MLPFPVFMMLVAMTIVDDVIVDAADSASRFSPLGKRSAVNFIGNQSVVIATSGSGGGEKNGIIGKIDEVSGEGYGSFCETETFHATCALDEVIIMTRALYGRMRISRCVKLDYGHLGCVADVLELADTRCSGRRRCEIRIPDPEFARNKPCPEDLKPYLEASYKCVKVQTTRDFCIYPKPTPVAVSTAASVSGFLASLTTELTGCGSVVTPWLVIAQPGQTIRVTLYDFAVARLRSPGIHSRTQQSFTTPSPSSASSQTLQPCTAYANLREPAVEPGAFPGGGARTNTRATVLTGKDPFSLSAGARTATARNVTVCGGGVLRKSVVYVSVGNRLEVGLERGGDLASYGVHYLIEYQAIGCPDPTPSSNAISLRNGDSITIRCNYSRDIYQMKCKDGRWTGERINCTHGISFNSVERLATSGFNMPYGLSVLLVVTIALVIGAFVLCSGLVVLNSRRGRRRRHNCCSGASGESDFCTSDGDTVSRAGEFVDLYGATTQRRLVPPGSNADLIHHQLIGSSPLHQHHIVSGTMTAGGGDKHPYVTASLVRHIGGSMAVRAATVGHQAGNERWDLISSTDRDSTVGVNENGKGSPYVYGVVRSNDLLGGGSTTMYGTSITLNEGDRSRPSVTSHLTTRVFPPVNDHLVGANDSSSPLHGRLPCGCYETYSSTGGTTSNIGSESADQGSAEPGEYQYSLGSVDSGRSRTRRLRIGKIGTGSCACREGTNDGMGDDGKSTTKRQVIDESSSVVGSLAKLGDEAIERVSESTRNVTRNSFVTTTMTSPKVARSGDHCNETPRPTQDDNGGDSVEESRRRGALPMTWGYMVPELLSDCTPYSGGRNHADRHAP